MIMKGKNQTTLIWLWISILIFAASNAVVAKIGQLGALHPTPLGHNPISFCNLFFAGNLVAGITLLIVYRKSWKLNALKSIPCKSWVCALILILFGGVLTPAFFFIALMLTEVTNVVLISTIEVPLALLFAFLFFREKALPTAIIGALIAALGIILIFLLKQPMGHPMTMKMIDIGNPAANHFLQTLPRAGEILTVLATLMSVISVQLSRKLLDTISVGVFSVMRMIVGVIFFSIVVLSVFGVHHFDDLFSPFLWEWMLIYGAVIIVIGQITWFKGVKKASSTDISMATALTPIAGTFFAFLILREIPDFSQIIGGVVILIGIGISLIGEYRSQKRKAKFEKPSSFSGV